MPERICFARSVLFELVFNTDFTADLADDFTPFNFEETFDDACCDGTPFFAEPLPMSFWEPAFRPTRDERMRDGRLDLIEDACVLKVLSLLG